MAHGKTRTGVLTEVVEDFERTSDGIKSISKTVIPFIRGNTITFTSKGLKPFTKLYVYFDKQLVNVYVTPTASGAVGTAFGTFSDVETPVAGSTLISDASGNCDGTFIIPDPKIEGNPKFSTGDIDFVITADPNNKQVGGAANQIVARETYAEAIYSAKGILDTQQETIISTRNAVIRTSQLNEDSTTDHSQMSHTDPLAQTFIVMDDKKTAYSADVSGTFLTSCDVFFSQKDDTYPVTIEIRNVINGDPASKVLPFSRKTLQSAEVTTSTDGNTSTTFTFPSPVYVQGGTEYAICLLTNTPEYKVWIADVGTIDTSGNEITEQPHVGVLFRSSNNTTWIPSPTQDLKFSLKIAKFDTNAAGTVTLQNQTLPVKLLNKNPLEMLDADTTLKIRHEGHGMHTVGNNVTVDGIKSGAKTTLNGAITATATSITLTSGTNFDDTSGKYSRDASNAYLIKIDDEIISYTTISGTGITSATRAENSTTAVAHSNGAIVELFQIHKVPLTEINKTHIAIGNIQSDSYTIALSTTPVVDGEGSISTFGGDAGTATENAQYDVSTTNMGLLVPSRTKISSGFLSTTGTSISGSEQPFVKATTSRTLPLEDNYYWDTTKLVASSINETNEMAGAKSLNVLMTLSSEVDRLSPVIDTQRLSMVAVSNKVDVINSSSDVYPTSIYKPMTEPHGDNHSSIYLTKQIDLETPATSLRVLFDAQKDNDASIKVLFRTLRVDDEFKFNEIGFRFFNDDGTIAGSGNPDNFVRASERLVDTEFLEYEYTAGVTDAGIGNPLDEFISFQIKIVMRTTNQARPPLLKSLRVLALAT